MQDIAKVLLIDDNPGDVRLIQELLREEPEATLSIDSAGDLASGIDRLEHSSYDAVLLDLALPDSRDLDTLHRVRHAAPQLPVVVLTGNDDSELPLEAVRRGAQDYLVKGTFDVTLLVKTVRYAIERARNLEALRESEERYRVLYDRVEAGVLELDLDGRITAANPALVRMLDYSSEADLQALDFGTDVVSDAEDFENWLAVLRFEGRAHARLRLRSRTGKELVVLATVHALHDRAHVLVGYQGMLTDITEVDRLSQRLSYEATHDSLTGLSNRRMFEARVREALESVRDGGLYALCYIDLDEFKIINDTSGHVAGDEMLKQLGQALLAGTRRGDVLARLGGDEFGLLFEVADDAEAMAGARRLLGAIEEFRFAWGDKYFDTRASIGLMLVDVSASDMEEVLSAADAACYAAKERGGGRIYVGQSGADTLNRRIREMQWVMRIKAALNDNRLRLYQQPIESVHAGHDGPKRFEVLLRKLDTDGRIYMPGEFLPAMERYNFVATVDRWVLETALGWLGEHGARLGPYLCAINLSGQSLGEPEFLDFVQAQLEKSGVRPASLCFEITESAAIRNLAAAKQLIGSLRSIGCRFALDDFGSGLSSFSYLRNLPVDYVKLDGLFTTSIEHDPINRAMVKSIAEVAEAMGKETIAEFVEDRAAVPLLADLGVDYVQGFAIGAPVPLGELLEAVPGVDAPAPRRRDGLRA